MRIVGFGHIKGVGKDSAGAVLEKRGFTRQAFADPVRTLVYDINPAVAFLVDEHGWEVAKRKYPATVRGALITVANAVRVLDPDFWMRMTLFDDLSAEEDFVITDVRYENEAEGILNRGGEVWRIDRDGCIAEDVTDRALLDWDGWTGVIENNGTLEELEEKVLKALEL